MATENMIPPTTFDSLKHEKAASMNVDSTFADHVDTNKHIDELIDETDDLLELNDSRTSKTHDNRIKHKNRRYTRSCEYPDDSANNKFLSTLSASLPDHFTFMPGLAAKSWSKKYSKNSRRSRKETGRGLAKKGGAGGKFTWGAAADQVDESVANTDPSDINYESDKEENCEYIVITPPLTDEEIERHVTASITEYYEHGDSDEVGCQLEEYNFDGKEYQIVVIAVTLAMEHKASHRELTSVLISDLYSRLLNMPDYEQAFKVLIKNMPDLVLDTPDAAIVLGNFIARAIADDCLPPCFVTKLKQTLKDPLQLQAIEHAASLLESKFSMLKLDSIWGEGGGHRPVVSLVSRIQLLLDEYISSADMEEATRCLTELEVPHLHHHLIYEGVMKALEDMRERTLTLIGELLQYLYKTIIVTVDQLTLGFNKVYEEIEDIVIDVPLAYPLLEKLVAKCESFLPKELVKKCPVQQRGRRRFLSESDGKFKEDPIEAQA